MFARPFNRDERIGGLWKLVESGIALPAKCSPEQVAKSLTRLGPINVSLDDSVSESSLSIKSSTVAELLFVDLRENWLDFRFVPDGIVIFSSRDSYKYRDTLEIRPANGSEEAIRDIVLDLTGHPEDWDEQGGEGSVIIRDDGVVEVNHKASTLLEIEYKLKKLGKLGEQRKE